MMTFGQKLDRYEGFGPGFDFVRIALAMEILAYHSSVVIGASEQLAASPGWIITNALVPMFFAVSGFLIAGSALRLRLPDFLVNRGLRIIPALAVEIIFSAVVLGAIFTTEPLAGYFTDRDFWQYFLNIVGFIQYDLPGVFADNPSAGVVNQSLWTVPYEFLCYFVMSVIMITGAIKRRGLLLACTVAYIALGVVLQFTVGIEHAPRMIRSLFFGRGSLAFECFLAGICVYLYRERVPFDGRIAMVLAAGCLFIAVAGNAAWGATGLISVAFCPILTYIILYIGLSAIPKVPFYSRGDYSYGIYLYGYPIQQAIEELSGGTAPWLLNFALSLLVVTLWAVFSWTYIEKPILMMRKKFSFVGRRLDEAPAVGKSDAPSTATSAG